MVPRLSDRQMFWSGIIIAVIGILISEVLPHGMSTFSSEVQADFYYRFGSILGSLTVIARTLGAMLIGGGLILRALQAPKRSDRAPRNDPSADPEEDEDAPVTSRSGIDLPD